MAIFTHLLCHPTLALLLLLLPAYANADPAPTAESAVRNAAARLLKNELAQVALIEPQINLKLVPPRDISALPLCTQALEVEALDMSALSRLRFAVRCPSDNGWRAVYTVRADISAKVPVLAHDVAAGQRLDETDIEWGRHHISHIGEIFTHPADVVGMSSRTPLRRGQALRKKMLATAVLVKRGQEVNIVAQQEQIEVTVAAEALENGRYNDIIRVKNKATGKTLRARVLDAGTVSPAR